MPSFLHNVGLRAGSSPAMSSIPIPNYGPWILLGNFVFAYGLLSSRTAKQYFGIDHNEAPREDLSKYGESAVSSGKLTRKQLAMLKRNEAASANAVENYTLLVGAVVLATAAKVDSQAINAAGLVYTLARTAYALVYVFIDDRAWSQMRGICWWTGNVSCFYMLWKAAKIIG